jgi:hypothetical protein
MYSLYSVLEVRVESVEDPIAYIFGLLIVAVLLPILQLEARPVL